jgi:hypothetical protein
MIIFKIISYLIHSKKYLSFIDWSFFVWEIECNLYLFLLYNSNVFCLFIIVKMLPRSLSTSSCIQSFNENLLSTTNLHHYESLQNLQQSKWEKSSHSLTIDNSYLNLPIIPHPKKGIMIETLPINKKKVKNKLLYLKEQLFKMISIVYLLLNYIAFFLF